MPRTRVPTDARRASSRADGPRDTPVPHSSGPAVGPAHESWVLRDVHALLAQIRDYAVITLTVDGTVLSWNAAAEQVKGYRSSEVVGTSFTRFYTEADQRADLPGRLLRQAAEEGVAHSVGWRVRRGGTRFWADVTISAVRDADGSLAGFVKVTRDVTDQHLAELAREQQHAAFTHDLRAPLTAALGYVDLALEELDAAGVPAAMLERAVRSLRRLDTMMERQLGAPRSPGSASADVLELEAIRIDQVVPATVRAALTAPAADRVRLRLSTTARTVLADRQAMERVLANVVGNALRYSDGEVVVATEAVPTGTADGARPGTSLVRITVTDSGRGIHPDDLERIFEPGERGRLATADGGHGLGLDSVRRLMARQHGDVRIESTLGVGTTVFLELRSAG
ncbi:PAS domain S-box protein [Nocardioides sp. ChNu-153]|uniref:ATP-binding protein n=1 Tax=Nocardioides sp. ChNu-153 TaxID=2779364 RepID=UPI002650A33F|nr:ATP-binding protein [Nocardioides sp. ChNu-153]MDN7123090.1 PAS domain S-box protein [Nocardioides sp. ChNu-153]